MVSAGGKHSSQQNCVVLLQAKCQLCGSGYLEAKATTSKRKPTHELLPNKHKNREELFLEFIFMGFGHQGDVVSKVRKV